MDYIYLLIGSVIVISCFYFIVAPFFSNEEKTVAFAEGNDAEMPVEMIYEAVNELEMDFLMKKISKEDFETMKKRYHALAAGYLKTDSSGKNSQSNKNKNNTDDETEREILKELNKLRKQKGRTEG